MRVRWKSLTRPADHPHISSFQQDLTAKDEIFYRELIGALILGDRFWVVRGGRPAGVAASWRGPKRVRSAWGTCRAATKRPRPLDRPWSRPARSNARTPTARAVPTAYEKSPAVVSPPTRRARRDPGPWTNSRSLTY